MTPVTQDAIRVYQNVNGMDEDGEISQRFMAHLTNSVSILERSEN